MKLGVVLMIVVGALLIYSGIYNRKFTETLGDLFSGKLSGNRDILAPAVRPVSTALATPQPRGVVSV